MVNEVLSQILIYLTDFSFFMRKILGGSEGQMLPKPHYSWLVIFFIFFVIFLVGLSLGRSKAMINLLAIYIAAYTEPLFPYYESMAAWTKKFTIPSFWPNIFIFFFIYLIAVVVLNKSSLRNRLVLSEVSFFLIPLITVAWAGLCLSALVGYLPSEWFEKLPRLLMLSFATKEAQFWWAFIPVILFYFIGREEKKKP